VREQSRERDGENAGRRGRYADLQEPVLRAGRGRGGRPVLKGNDRGARTFPRRHSRLRAMMRPNGASALPKRALADKHPLPGRSISTAPESGNSRLTTSADDGDGGATSSNGAAAGGTMHPRA